jgi:hypothetical protein
MLNILFLAAAAQSAALISDPPPATTQPPAAARPAAKPAKPRRKKCANSDGADTGSHIDMGTCLTDEELARKELEGELHYRQSATVQTPGAPR